ISAYTTVPWNAQIDLGLINPQEPLFVRSLLDSFVSDPVFLQPNYQYAIVSNTAILPDTLPLRLGTDCPEGLCTGVWLGISIPDSAGNTAAAMRWHSGMPTGYNNPPNVNACLPTEYFPDQSLRQFILKFSFDTLANLDGYTLELQSAQTEQLWFPPNYLNAVVAESFNWNGSLYEVPIYQTSNGWNDINFLALHDDTSYPDALHPTWIEFRPEPNTETPQTIALNVEMYQNLEFQPFTYIRGALVEGSDSVRHTAVLQNNGGNWCINWLDVIFGNQDEYQHLGGAVEVNHPMSCMQFRDNSVLRVGPDAVLNYGNTGAGMLAFCGGARIVLEPGATLELDATLQISDCSADGNAPPVVVELHTGSLLHFSENAWLTNRFAPDMRLAVHLLGGTLDDSALSPEEKALIERVYPVPDLDFSKNIGISPNPFSSDCALEYLAGSAETVTLTWVNEAGQLLGRESFIAEKGLNQTSLHPPAAGGLYFLQVEAASGTAVLKLVKTGE
ncbi:MAG TPA: T9SS type A sorting domain-containing protein, partial [Saprospiraceae bacterium]|nr:T9SS type A sorting domain-containing protein [Saprospiraceae bacterium]